MTIQFHQTGYGRKFFDSDLPRLIRALEKIGKNLEEAAGGNDHSSDCICTGQADAGRIDEAIKIIYDLLGETSTGDCTDRLLPIIDLLKKLKEPKQVKYLRSPEEIEEFLTEHKGEIKDLRNNKYAKNGGWNGLMDALVEVEEKYGCKVDCMDNEVFEEIVEEAMK